MRFRSEWLALGMLVPAAAAGQETARLVVDSASQEIVISVENISIAPATPYTHHTASSASRSRSSPGASTTGSMPRRRAS